MELLKNYFPFENTSSQNQVDLIQDYMGNYFFNILIIDSTA